MLKRRALAFMLKLLAKPPLCVVHLLGAALGWASYLSYKKYAKLINQNLKLSALSKDEVRFKKTLHRNISETGKAFLETFAIWFKDYSKLSKWYQACTGWEHVEAALAKGKGIIFLTPHLGCFEITSLYYGQFHPITVLFRPPRQSWLMPMISQGRQRGNVSLAPANAQGVKLLLQALKRGEAIGILPDQAPNEGEGEWVPFFSRPAYTMTLASKLAEKSGAQVMMAFGERLENGRGYHIHIKPIKEGGINTPALLNKEIEQAIAQCPSQYMWGYDRYKVRN
jgi:Kdo2-lipid IVA lauroyltransferase/acyltransferase